MLLVKHGLIEVIFLTVFLEGIEIAIFTSITLWVERVQLSEIKVLRNLWYILNVCHRRRKGICICGVVMENSAVSSQFGENMLIVSIHSNSVCPCTLTTSFRVFCNIKLSGKRLKKVWKRSWAKRLMQKLEARYSGTCLNSHYLNCL